MHARIFIRPKAGILDPQGEAVAQALPALGFDGVTDIRVGKIIELETEKPAELEQIVQQLLANPTIEDYEIVTE